MIFVSFICSLSCSFVRTVLLIVYVQLLALAFSEGCGNQREMVLRAHTMAWANGSNQNAVPNPLNVYTLRRSSIPMPWKFHSTLGVEFGMRLKGSKYVQIEWFHIVENVQWVKKTKGSSFCLSRFSMGF
jgi:hypothetical protein